MVYGLTFSLTTNTYLPTTTVLIFYIISNAATCYGDTFPQNPDVFQFSFPSGEKKQPITKKFTVKDMDSGFIDPNYAGASEIRLLSGDTLYTKLYNSDNIQALLLSHDAVLYMCIVVEGTDLVSIVIGVREIKGNCTGPKLMIINNTDLEYIDFGVDFVKSFQRDSQKQVSVHGNRKIRRETLQNLTQYTFAELQQYGECMLPSPLQSLNQILSDTCTMYYGPLDVNSTVTSLSLSNSTESKFEWIGCVHIENTALLEANFLRIFKKFSPTPGCKNLIKGNTNLCLTNEYDFISSLFRDVQILDNKESCENECIGGLATNDYLKSIRKCSKIYGDLVISNWKGAPEYVGVLGNISHIRGRLIIANNTLLGNFKYFSNLETIETRDGSNPLLIVRNNSDLICLPMPKLKNSIDIRKSDPRVEAADNPIFAGCTTAAPSAVDSSAYPEVHSTTLVARTYTHEATYNKQINQSNIPFSRQQSSKIRKEYIIMFSGAVALLILVIIVAVILLLVLLPKKGTMKLPPDANLSKKSIEVLVSMSKEISSKDPIYWCTNDSEMIWMQGRSAGGADAATCGTDTRDPLRASMIPLAVNARLPVKSGFDNHKLLLHRVREIAKYEYVIMIGNGPDVSKVVPRLPNYVGGISSYKDSNAGATYSYELMEVYHLGPRTTYYKYQLRELGKPKSKRIHLLMFDWEDERLPTECGELLRILQFCSDKKTICVSDRRKEVFSLLYLIFNTVRKAKQERILKLFQFHTRNCNGAPLDRDEMLFALWTVISWTLEAASHLRQDEGLINWCQAYARMAAFAKTHPNVRKVQRSYISGQSIQSSKEEGQAFCNRNVPLSERPRALGHLLEHEKGAKSEDVSREASREGTDMPTPDEEYGFQKGLAGKTAESRMSVRKQGADQIKIKGADSSYQSKDDKAETLSDDVKELKKGLNLKERDDSRIAGPPLRQEKTNVRAEMMGEDDMKQPEVAGLKQTRNDKQEFIQSEPMF